MANSKKTLWLLLLLALIIGGFFIYKTLFPGGPDLTPVPNPIRDRATTSKNIDESNLPNNLMKNAYFGDLHVHTSLSFDAYIGGTVATPSDAYRFAKGEAINIFGTPIKLKRPLDFAGISDHAEFIGEFYTAQTKGAKGYYAIVPQTLRKAAGDAEAGLKLFERMRSTKTKHIMNLVNLPLWQAMNGLLLKRAHIYTGMYFSEIWSYLITQLVP